MTTRRRTSTQQPKWDLRDLYNGIDDPKINKTLRASEREAIKFRKRYAGKLSRYTKSAKSFLAVLEEYEQILQAMVKPYSYASLLFADSQTAKGRGAFMQKMRMEYTAISNHLAFFTPDLLEIPKKRLIQLSKSPVLASYRNYLKEIIGSQKHQLPERERQIFSDMAITGKSGFTRLFEEEFVRKHYSIKKGKTTKEYSLTQALDLLHDDDRAVRKQAQEGFTEGLRDNAWRLTYITNTLLQDKAIRDRYHHFDNPEANRHLENQIDRKAVDQLVKTVRGSAGDVARYYQLKARLLGLKKLYDYDRYAPVGGKERKVPFQKAREQVLESFSNFHPEFGRMGKDFFTKRWVDAADRPGKRSGAFCSFCTPDVHPWVFMNYSGTGRDVYTLAHELGHGIHAYSMRKQSYLNFDTPLTIAETASVFAEQLLFQYRVERARTPYLKLKEYMNHIENIMATVHRQISMFEFEREIHAASAKYGELTTEQINGYWRETQSHMFKGSVELTSNYDYWWAYIPHFIHTPFYVYAYSFGQLLALGFAKLYEERPDSFAEKYLDFLASGNTCSPDELLRPFRINLNKPDIWRDGIKTFRRMIREAEKLAEQAEI